MLYKIIYNIIENMKGNPDYMQVTERGSGVIYLI